MDIRNYEFCGEMIQITSCINSNIRFYFLNTFLSLLNKTYKLKVVMDLQKKEGELNTVCVKSGVDLNLPFPFTSQYFVTKEGIRILLGSSRCLQRDRIAQFIYTVLKNFDDGLPEHEMITQQLNFRGNIIDIIIIRSDGMENYFLGLPFSKALNYKRPDLAISRFVSVTNRRTFDKFNIVRQTYTSEDRRSQINPLGSDHSVSFLPTYSLFSFTNRTLFINFNGLLELITKSKQPFADDMRQLIFNVISESNVVHEFSRQNIILSQTNTIIQSSKTVASQENSAASSSKSIKPIESQTNVESTTQVPPVSNGPQTHANQSIEQSSSRPQNHIQPIVQVNNSIRNDQLHSSDSVQLTNCQNVSNLSETTEDGISSIVTQAKNTTKNVIFASQTVLQKNYLIDSHQSISLPIHDSSSLFLIAYVSNLDRKIINVIRAQKKVINSYANEQKEFKNQCEADESFLIKEHKRPLWWYYSTPFFVHICKNSVDIWKKIRKNNPVFFYGVFFLNYVNTVFCGMSVDEIKTKFDNEKNPEAVLKNLGMPDRTTLLVQCTKYNMNLIGWFKHILETTFSQEELQTKPSQIEESYSTQLQHEQSQPEQSQHEPMLVDYD